MTTCICIGDPHFQHSNIKDVSDLVRRILSYVSKIQPDFIVCLGDILHTHEKVSVTPFKMATDFLLELSRIAPTYLIIGNHDYINNSQFLTENHAFNALKQWKNMTIVDNFIIHEYNGKRFGFCPYVPPGRFMEALDQGNQLWELTECIFAHQEFYGCKMGAIYSEIGDPWDENYPLVISGHIHDHQIVGTNVFYTGSIMQHGFAETSKKYMWKFTFQNDSYTYDKIDLDMKRKKIIYLDIEDISSFDTTKSQKYHLKLDLKGTSEQFKKFRSSKKYKELTSLGIKILFTPIHKNILELKNKIDYKNKTYLSIFKELVNHESEHVQELYKDITQDYSEPVELEFCDNP